MSDKKQISLKGNVEVAKAAEYLRDLATSLEAGQVHVENFGESVDLSPKDQVEMEVEAKQRPHKESVTIELTWRKDGPPTDLDLKITAGKAEEADAEAEQPA